MNNDTQTIIELYLDYVNNFLTVDRFAEHHNMSITKAIQTIDMGKHLNNHKSN